MTTGDVLRERRVRVLAILAALALASTLLVIPARAAPSGTIKLEKHPGVALPGTSSASEMAVADVDNDGDRDLVVVTTTSKQLITFLNDGSGNFALRENRALPAAAFCVAVANIDSDGNPDYVWGGSDFQVHIEWGDGTGMVDGGRIPKILAAGSSTVTDVAILDAEPDGWSDVLAVNSWGDSVYLHYHPGAGAPAVAVTAMPPGTDPRRVAVGYLDSGFSQDYAVLGNNGWAYLYANDGSGNFAAHAASPLATGPSPTDVTLAWLDEDERQDVVLCDFGQRSVQVYLTGGSSTGFTRKDHAVGVRPVAIAADWIGTGPETDLAVASHLDNKVVFLENDGAGGFVDAGDVAVNGPFDVVLDLANPDIKTDVFALDPSRVDVFQNLSPPSTRRYAGADRYETAVEISKSSWGGKSDTVVIATGELFPDALAGTPLAFAHQAPVLLTRSDSLPPSVAAEIGRLGAKNAVILGGTGAVSETVRGQIQAAGVPAANITRIGGSDRYETARLIALALQDAIPGTDVRTAFVATGENFPDALAGGAFAAARYGPILLVRQDSVPPATAAVLNELPSITESYVLGGEGVVSTGVAGRFPNPTRLAGPDRYGTSRAIAEAAIDAELQTYGRLSWTLGVATGEDFPDALAIGPNVAVFGGPVLLTRSQSLPPDTRDVIASYAPHVLSVRVAGGTGAVSETVVDEMEAAY